MATIASEIDAVMSAEERLAARKAELRADWRNLKASSRNVLTSPVLVGGIALAGACLGARPRSVRTAVECKCAKPSPSLLRIVLMAFINPLLEDAVARGLGHFGADRAATTATPAAGTG